MGIFSPDIPTLENRESLEFLAIDQVKKWLEESRSIPASAASQRLAGLLQDDNGLAFAVGFVDGVVRPEDVRVAARNLANLTSIVPRFLSPVLQFAIKLGGFAGQIAPWIVIPIARRVLRSMVSHLVIDATDEKLGAALSAIRAGGATLNINLLGESVLGEKEALKRLKGTADLLRRDDVDYVSIKVSSAVAPHSSWAFDEAVEHITTQLEPLYRIAADPHAPKFINLDMEEYHDLDLTIAVFTRILDQPEFRNLYAGIVLQAYLPDALGAMIRLQKWAHARRAAGGAAIKVRLVKGANLPMEQVDAELHDWPLATVHSKQDADTNYKRVLNYALTEDHIANIRMGVAGHNLFDIAFAWHLATQRNVTDGIEIEMLLGMAQAQAEVVRRTTGGLLLYTPVVHPQEFDVAIAYLIRRLEEGASSDNFMSAVFELDKPEFFAREEARFRASMADLDESVPEPHRVQDRTERAQKFAGAFRNAPDTDPAIKANRDWGYTILGRVEKSTLGVDRVHKAQIANTAELNKVMGAALRASTAWSAKSAAERAEILHRVGDVLEAHRAELIEVAASETGKTIDQADPEISEAIDFAHYYAERALELDTVDGAEFVPARITLVTPPWNFPIAIPAGSALAALATGSAVIFKPAGQAARCGAYLASLLWKAGVPKGALQSIQLSESDLGEQLISDPRIDRVILTGGYETAQLFRTFRPDLPLLAETSGKNSIIVTPSADLDLAAKDVAYSAFGHAGQKCSAASVVILVGSVARSDRFRRQLVDAVESMPVDYPWNPMAKIGPIVEPAAGKLLRGLTELDGHEKWLIQPRRLDDTGRLWSPGIRDGVAPGAPSHMTEYFGPVLSIMTANSLDDALQLQNAVDYGLTAGIHSLDSDEISEWLSRVQAGNLYVNRGITGAIVQRQPFGGWKRSAIGPGSKAGGPNYLMGLGTWKPRAAAKAAARDITHRHPDVDNVLAVAKTQLRPVEYSSLARAAVSDSRTPAQFFANKDVTGLSAEINMFRYLPAHTTVRFAGDATLYDLWRMVALSHYVYDAHFSIDPTNSAVAAAAGALHGIEGITTSFETAEDFDKHLAHANDIRVRWVGSLPEITAESPLSNPTIAVYSGPVTESGRVELLPFYREQAISVTAHRFGNPLPMLERVTGL